MLKNKKFWFSAACLTIAVGLVVIKLVGDLQPQVAEPKNDAQTVDNGYYSPEAAEWRARFEKEWVEEYGEPLVSLTPEEADRISEQAAIARSLRVPLPSPMAEDKEQD